MHGMLRMEGSYGIQKCILYRTSGYQGMALRFFTYMHLPFGPGLFKQESSCGIRNLSIKEIQDSSLWMDQNSGLTGLIQTLKDGTLASQAQLL